jgi:hypothetical protein
VPGEVGDLHLPDSRMHDAPGRHQEDRRLFSPEYLVADSYAVAFEVVVINGSAARIRLSFPLALPDQCRLNVIRFGRSTDRGVTENFTTQSERC